MLASLLIAVGLGTCTGLLVAPASSLADAWQNNPLEPVWKLLRQQLISEYGSEMITKVAAPIVPATLVYALSVEEKAILEPVQREGKGELNIHLIGSTYLYEGLSDWQLLARSMPSYIHTVNAHLILGTPFQVDGPVHNKSGQDIDFPDDLPQEQVEMQSSMLLQIRNSTKKVEFGPQELRSKVCREFTEGSTTVVVHCHEKLYQNVWDEIPLPHLAFMANPGFPLPWRRAYDGVLVRLLQHSIPSVISAQQMLDTGDMEDLVGAALADNATPIVARIMEEEQWSDEAYQCLETVKEYGAEVKVEAAPFPYAYFAGTGEEGEDEEDQEDEWIVKNSVVHFFAGLSPGAPAIEMAGTPEEDSQEHTGVEKELLESLHVPVSRPFAQAMRRWAEYENPRCAHAETVDDWVACCKDDGC